MSLYIRDARVAELAEKVRHALGARTKTEAVRQALEDCLVRARKTSFQERNAAVFALADTAGHPDPDFDFKAFRDEMWGDS